MIITKKISRRPIKQFGKSEFLTGIALLIGAACFAANGNALWKNKKQELDDGWMSIEQSANFEKYMREYRFKELRQFLPMIFQDNNKKPTHGGSSFLRLRNSISTD